MALDRQRAADESALSTSGPDASIPLARSVLERFRYGARKAAAQVYSSESGGPKEASTIAGNFGPSFSQTTRHRTGLKIRALDINQHRTHVVLAGGKILKTLRISQEPSCIEDFNLRTTAVNYAWNYSRQNSPSAGKTRARIQDSNSVQRDLFDIEDVAWSNNDFRDYIATAARNGKIMLYDMNRPGVEVGSFDEHHRQVHKVDFNPLEGACLLSGSQDGTVRLWDLRSYSNSATSRASVDTFAGRAEGVRHVKWSPRDTWSFAFGTDNGVIQRWDTRNTRSPVLKFSAHKDTCNSIDWHPDGKHLISGGKDKIVKVWDISPDAPRGKAWFSVRTPTEVQNVRWRPSCFVTEPQEFQTIKQCTHFASSYRTYAVVQIWDLRRPHMPFREVNHCLNNGTTDMLWRSRDLLWTVGPEGEFAQTDVSFAAKTLDRRPLAALTCGPGGQMTFVCRRRTSWNWSNPKTKQSKETAAQLGKGAPRSPDRLPLGRSPADDSFDEKFLELPARRGHSRAPSFKSSKSFSATPPSTDEMMRMITTDLRTSMNLYEAFKPAQASRTGSLPGTFQAELVTYLVQNYKHPLNPKDYDVYYLENLGTFFEQNAASAQRASLYRDAQMWRILGFQVSKDLRIRIETNRKKRLNASIDPKTLGNDFGKAIRLQTGENDGSAHAGKDDQESQQKPITSAENQSNATTPVVSAMEKSSGTQKPEAESSEDLQLPPAFSSGAVRSSNHVSKEMEFARFKAALVEDDKEPNGIDFHGTESPTNRSPQLLRAPYTVDIVPSQTQSILVPNHAPRKTSSESFWMFSTSSESPDRRGNANSFRSNASASTGRNSSNEHDDFRYNASFQSDVSAQSNLSSDLASQESNMSSYLPKQESFLDLPTHGNLRVDDFVEKKPMMATSIRGVNNKNDSMHESLALHALDEVSPGAKHPQHDLDVPNHITTTRVATITEPTRLRGPLDLTSSSNGPSKTPRVSSEGSKSSITYNNLFLQSLENKDVLLTDYLTPVGDHDTTGTRLAIGSHEMIVKLLNWYCSQGDALTAAHIFFLSAPILIRSEPGMKSLSQIHTSRESEGEVPAALPPSLDPATSIAQDQGVDLDAIGVSAAFIESLLTTYHDELMSLGLIQSATLFRRLAYPAFPGVYEEAVKDVEIHTLCLGCSHPINNPANKMYCESCRKRQDNCAICWCTYSPFDWVPGIPLRTKAAKTRGSSFKGRTDSLPTAFACENPSLWATCPLCNHSTHVACADEWFANTSSELEGSGGGCPVQGCICDCVRGFYRNERLAMLEARERQKHQNTSTGGIANSVKRDSWAVSESRAVGRVRGALRDNNPISEGPRGPEKADSREKPKSTIGYLTAQSRTMSDEGKRVRLVAPNETRR